MLPLQHFGLTREEVARIEGVVAQEVEEDAMQPVRPGLGRGVQRTAGLAELGRVRALLHLEFLEGVDRRLDERPALVMVGDVDAIEHEGGLAAAHAADGGTRNVVRANAQQVATARQQYRAGREARELVEATAVQREVHDLGVRHDVAQGAGLGVEERRTGGNNGALGDRAHLELHVDARGLVDLDLDGLDHRRLEAIDRDGR